MVGRGTYGKYTPSEMPDDQNTRHEPAITSNDYRRQQNDKGRVRWGYKRSSRE
eukprot:CAMPEP_0201659944 /NCGR_PEP_ID=MMETSP0494-20130426/2689_1 /ASSEMBLY_ACC=CAM_ASM_000839 /TAXON_ID=420259 /ORGANISM="Thalassiosira gravida, Strain GMp14c1" /LENGTH=52 /DNA_ID=CAMNT_0048137645 /DNA_START=53 /DNA_END=211 /DNA_ORIENTATION=+